VGYKGVATFHGTPGIPEQIAITVERVTFEAPEYGNDQVTWRMTETEAATEIAKCVATRLVTAEVQEMLEPMLGDFRGFSRGTTNAVQRQDGLLRNIRRFESLLHQFLRGKLARLSEDVLDNRSQNRTFFESSANFAAGLVFMGSAACRQLDRKPQRLFALQPFEGAFWRFVCLLHTGGIQIDQHIADRLFRGCTIAKVGKQIASDGVGQLSDMDVPIKTALFRELPGFESRLNEAALVQAAAVQDLLIALEIATLVFATLGPTFVSSKNALDTQYLLDSVLHRRHPYGHNSLFLARALAEAGIISEDPEHDRSVPDLRHAIYELVRERPTAPGFGDRLSYAIQEMLHYLSKGKRKFMRSQDGPSYAEIFLRFLYEVTERQGDHRSSEWADRIREALRYFR
jgi:hypothetical protein